MPRNTRWPIHCSESSECVRAPVRRGCGASDGLRHEAGRGGSGGGGSARGGGHGGGGRRRWRRRRPARRRRCADAAGARARPAPAASCRTSVSSTASRCSRRSSRSSMLSASLVSLRLLRRRRGHLGSLGICKAEHAGEGHEAAGQVERPVVPEPLEDRRGDQRRRPRGPARRRSGPRPWSCPARAGPSSGT